MAKTLEELKMMDNDISESGRQICRDLRLALLREGDHATLTGKGIVMEDDPEVAAALRKAQDQAFREECVPVSFWHPASEPPPIDHSRPGMHASDRVIVKLRGGYVTMGRWQEIGSIRQWCLDKAGVKDNEVTQWIEVPR
jgi:hypothetical protein